MTPFKSWLVNGRAVLLKCLPVPYINPGPRNVSEVNDLFSSSICETKLSRSEHGCTLSKIVAELKP